MALKLSDRVQETTTTTGTGTVTLLGAVTGFRTFASVMSVNDTCYYCIAGGSEWEVGQGTWNGTSFTRDTVFSSSNSGSLVSFSAGTKVVFIDFPGSVNQPAPVVTNLEFEPFAGTTAYTPGVGSWYFEPVYIPAQMSGGHWNRIVSFTSASNILQASSSVSFNSATTGSRGATLSYMNSLALYSLGTGTNSTRLESLWSNTFSIGLTHTVSVSSNTNATSLAVTNAVTMAYVASIDSAGNYTTTSISASTNRTTGASTMGSTAVSAVVSSIQNLLAGQCILPIGFNTTITAGNYWFAQAYTSATTTAGTTASLWSFSNQAALSVALQAAPRLWGQTASVANSGMMPGQGVYTSTSASPPATVAFASISSLGVSAKQYFNYVNSTI